MQNAYSIEIEELEAQSLNTSIKLPYQDGRYHKDSLNRYVFLGSSNQDHYLQPSDGKLALLNVQMAPKKHSLYLPLPPRTGIETRTWQTFYFWGQGGIRDIPVSILKWTYQESVENEHSGNNLLPYKYPLAAILLTFTAWLGNFNLKSFNYGRYPPLRYKNFRYAKRPRNRHEAEPGNAGVDYTCSLSTTHVVRGEGGRIEKEDDILARHLRPRRLCVITWHHNDAARGDHDNSFTYKVRDTDQWDKERPRNQSGEYVFVSYTREQFQTYTAEEIRHWEPSVDEQERKKRAGMSGLYHQDLQHLCQIGAKAARQARLSAFWIDVLCITKARQGAAGLNAHDSHRICDVARGANRMVIAVKEPVSNRILSPTTQTPERQLLQQWATRLWTLPEMLLAPTVHDLEIYHAKDGENGGKVGPSEKVPKRNMAEIAYPEDGERVRELVDHFESSLHLTQIELLTRGLECLLERKFNEYSQADPVYALMTLARRRPIPYEGQSRFEAFAHLSLLNDSNMLLERLLCMLAPPEYENKPGPHICDAWGVRLWDIFPTCQVSGIAGGNSDQTVVIDGAYGASIEWGHLKKVEFLKRKTAWRAIGEMASQNAIAWLAMDIIVFVLMLTAMKEDSSSPAFYFFLAIFVILLVITIILIAILPYAMFAQYRGKFWSTQAMLYGLEGVPKLDWLERQLFGFNEGRLTWSPHGSTLSQHRAKEGSRERLDDECEPMQPRFSDYMQTMREQSNLSSPKSSHDDKKRVFTIVDTYAMTITVIRAIHPPTVALVLGHEGGMRRAALCSYNHNTQTFHRETIVRMPTKILDRMDRVDQVRFSLKTLSFFRSEQGATTK